MVGLGEALCRVLVRELRSEGSANRRNAAFTCGTLLQAAAQGGAASEVAGHLPSILQVCKIYNFELIVQTLPTA